MPDAVREVVSEILRLLGTALSEARIPQPDLADLPAAARPPLIAILASFAGWLLLHLVVLLATRPPRVRPAAATQDLAGDEPPAVVNLLTNGWSVTEDAAESTLLDLAARGCLQLRQPAADPRQTTVHVVDADSPATSDGSAGARGRRAPGGDAPLTDYERQVLEHVRRVAVGEVAPLSALTFRDPVEAARWGRRFASAVEADAKRRGLVRRRVPAGVVTLLDLSAVAPALAIGWFAWELAGRSEPALFAVGLIPYAFLAGVAGRRRGLRGTARGRETAARWLGLRAYLEVDRAFAALPPAAVAVWDRYLAYGAALGVTRVASAALELGMGRRDRVWSAYGGQWHLVRVRYPGRASRYGATVAALVARGLLAVAAGAGLVRLAMLVEPMAGDQLPAAWHQVAVACAVAGGVLGVRGLYRAARALLDVVTTRKVRGEVLWVAPWRQARTDDGGVLVTLHYLALDDGTADRTTAWALPDQVTRGFGPGDVVEVTVRPWTRRVASLAVVQSRRLDVSTSPVTAGRRPAAEPPSRVPSVHRPGSAGGRPSGPPGAGAGRGAG